MCWKVEVAFIYESNSLKSQVKSLSSSPSLVSALILLPQKELMQNFLFKELALICFNNAQPWEAARMCTKISRKPTLC